MMLAPDGVQRVEGVFKAFGVVKKSRGRGVLGYEVWGEREIGFRTSKKHSIHHLEKYQTAHSMSCSLLVA